MTSSILWVQGTPITLKDSGGTYTITMSSLAAVTGRISPVIDLGARPLPPRLRWYMEAQWAASPVQFEGLEAYAAWWDDESGPAKPWAQVGSTDAALTATARANMLLAGSVLCETAGAGPFSKGGVIPCVSRYLTMAFYNNSAAKALVASGTFPFLFRLTPEYPQSQ